MRKNLEGVWPCPNSADSLRYAATESAEAIDAYLRNSRVDDIRNNDRDADIESELADCAMMLLTAMPDLPTGHIPKFVYPSLETVHYLVGAALLAYVSPGGKVNWKFAAMDALHSIGQMIDMKKWMLSKKWKFEGKYLGTAE